MAMQAHQIEALIRAAFPTAKIAIDDLAGDELPVVLLEQVREGRCACCHGRHCRSDKEPAQILRTGEALAGRRTGCPLEDSVPNDSPTLRLATEVDG